MQDADHENTENWFTYEHPILSDRFEKIEYSYTRIGYYEKGASKKCERGLEKLKIVFTHKFWKSIELYHSYGWKQKYWSGR